MTGCGEEDDEENGAIDTGSGGEVGQAQERDHEPARHVSRVYFIVIRTLENFRAGAYHGVALIGTKRSGSQLRVGQLTLCKMSRLAANKNA